MQTPWSRRLQTGGLKAMGRRARDLAEKEFERKKLADEFVDWLKGAAGTK